MGDLIANLGLGLSVAFTLNNVLFCFLGVLLVHATGRRLFGPAEGLAAAAVAVVRPTRRPAP